MTKNQKWKIFTFTSIGLLVVYFLDKSEIVTGPLKKASSAVSTSIDGAMNILEMTFSGLGSIADGAIDVIAGFWLFPWLHGVEPQHEASEIIEMWENNDQTASSYYYIWTHGGIYSGMAPTELVQLLIASYGYNDWTQKQKVSNYLAYDWATAQVLELTNAVGL